MKIDLTKNHIICGDNIEWLTDVPDESIDLCYIDPPFFSNRNYEVIWGNGYELRAFGDRFSGGISHYVEWMRPRIELIHKKLKSTGSIFLHCDGHASHRLRCVLDDTFGEQNFINEIIWKRQTSHNNAKQGAKHLGRLHDTILFYSKSANYQYQQLYESYKEDYVAKSYKNIDENGRRYTLSDITGPGGAAKGNPFYEFLGVKRYWRFSKERMNALLKAGEIVQKKPGSVPRQKRYLDQMPGSPLQDIWMDVDSVQSQSSERLGYPTQKPEMLVRRILEMASSSGGVVLDCFAGGGTTAKVAADLGRKFIVGDVSPVAVRIMAERLNFDCPNTLFELKNIPSTVAGFKKVNGHKFAELVCELMGWECNERKSGDGGIDGWDAVGTPIQVKNHKAAVGRPDIQKFVGALMSEKKKIGTFVAWEFSKQAIEYIAEVKRDHKIEILPKKCEEIFKGLLINEEKQFELDTLYSERKPKWWDGSSALAANSRKAKAVLDNAKEAAAKNARKKSKDREAS